MVVGIPRAIRAFAMLSAIALAAAELQVSPSLASEASSQGAPEHGGSRAPKIAKSGASLMVVWSQYVDRVDRRDIFGQRLRAADGTTTGPELHINTTTERDQFDPVVATLRDGSYVVVWESRHISSRGNIFGQRLSAAGKKIGREFRIDIGATGKRAKPVIATLADGRFIVVWQEYVSRSEPSLYGQIFTPAAQKVGNRLRLGSGRGADHSPDVAALADGGFALAWINDLLKAQRYDANGRSVGGITTLGRAPSVRVAGLGGSGYVVVWSSFTLDGCCVLVQWQRFTANGAAAGRRFEAGNTNHDQNEPAVASLANGGFVTVWSDNERRSICGKQYSRDGRADGGIFCERIPGASYIEYPSVVALDPDRFGVAFEFSTGVSAGVLDLTGESSASGFSRSLQSRP